jgi:hypothetical protein
MTTPASSANATTPSFGSGPERAPETSTIWMIL